MWTISKDADQLVRPCVRFDHEICFSQITKMQVMTYELRKACSCIGTVSLVANSAILIFLSLLNKVKNLCGIVRGFVFDLESVCMHAH